MILMGEATMLSLLAYRSGGLEVTHAALFGIECGV
jgi:hypothetical protein